MLAHFQVRAERRCGELLRSTEKNTGAAGLPGPGRGNKNAVERRYTVSSLTLADMGLIRAGSASPRGA